MDLSKFIWSSHSQLALEQMRRLSWTAQVWNLHTNNFPHLGIHSWRVLAGGSWSVLVKVVAIPESKSGSLGLRRLEPCPQMIFLSYHILTFIHGLFLGGTSQLCPSQSCYPTESKSVAHAWTAQVRNLLEYLLFFYRNNTLTLAHGWFPWPFIWKGLTDQVVTTTESKSVSLASQVWNLPTTFFLSKHTLIFKYPLNSR
jgi:hypothetical protein